MGISFKENCPDVRNTKVIDVLFAHWIVAMLSTRSSLPTSFDPVIDANSDNLKLLGFDTTQIVIQTQ